VFAPFLGADNLDKSWLKIVDVIAVVAAAGGATVTVGLAAQQFITGLSYNYGIAIGDIGIITLITGLTVGYTASAMVGIEKGIKRLSIFNIFLLLFMLSGDLRFLAGRDDLQSGCGGNSRVHQQLRRDVALRRRGWRPVVGQCLDDLLLGVVDQFRTDDWDFRRTH